MTETTPEAVETIAKALKQVLACDPQLLYKAASKCSSDYFFDRAKAEFENKPKTIEAIIFKTQVCQMLVMHLIRTGRAHLDADDMSNIAMYLLSIRDRK